MKVAGNFEDRVKNSSKFNKGSRFLRCRFKRKGRCTISSSYYAFCFKYVVIQVFNFNITTHFFKQEVKLDWIIKRNKYEKESDTFASLKRGSVLNGIRIEKKQEAKRRCDSLLQGEFKNK